VGSSDDPTPIFHTPRSTITDPDAIRRWWRDDPWANVAIASGGDLFVWDIDPRNGGDATMAALIAEHGPLPRTPTVATGGGGEQYYFRLPPNVVIKSRSVATGIDVKCKGLVIAPPSMHASGKRYTWKTPIDTPLADAPDWVLALACEGQSIARGEAASGGDGDDRMVFTTGSAASDFSSHPGAERGTQNDTMCRLLGVHLSRGDSPATVEALALAWAARCDPPIPEHEVYSRLRWAESKRTEGLDRVLVGGDDRSEGFLVSSPESERTNSNADADEVEDQGDMFVSSHAGNADILVEGSHPSPNTYHRMKPLMRRRPHSRLTIGPNSTQTPSTVSQEPSSKLSPRSPRLIRRASCSRFSQHSEMPLVKVRTFL